MTRGNRTYVPLLHDVGSITIRKAVKTTIDAIDRLQIVPGRPAETAVFFAQIQDWAVRNHVELLSELGQANVHRMLCELTADEDLQFVVPEVAPPQRQEATENTKKRRALAHDLRNAVVALRSGTILQAELFRSRSERTIEYSLSADLPPLPARTGMRKRPLANTEVLMARLLAEIDAMEGADPRVRAAYLLAESGVRSTESTRVTNTDLVDLELAGARNVALLTAPGDGLPTTKKLSVSGIWGAAARTVFLEPQVAAMIQDILRELRVTETTETPLTYLGRNLAAPGSKEASASLDGVIRRHLKRAGVTCPDVTPLSPTLWRTHQAVLQGRSFNEVHQMHGSATQGILLELNLTHDNSEADKKGIVHLFQQGIWVATVPKTGFFDYSTERTRSSRIRHEPGKSGRCRGAGCPEGKTCRDCRAQHWA